MVTTAGLMMCVLFVAVFSLAGIGFHILSQMNSVRERLDENERKVHKYYTTTITIPPPPAIVVSLPPLPTPIKKVVHAPTKQDELSAAMAQREALNAKITQLEIDAGVVKKPTAFR